MDAKEFGAALKKLRNNKGLTLTELGNKIGYSNPYLSQIENGKKGIPSPELLGKIATALDIEHTHLMYLAGYLFDVDFNKDKEEAIKKDIKKMTEEEKTDLHDLLKEDAPLSYKDRPLTKEEKQKLLTIIETIIG